MRLSEVAVELDLLRDVHRFHSYKLQQGNGDARVPGGDLGLGLDQMPPAALQVSGRRAVLGRDGQLVVEHGEVLGLDLVALGFGHQTLRDQPVGVGVRDALPGSGRMQQCDKVCFIT